MKACSLFMAMIVAVLLSLSVISGATAFIFFGSRIAQPPSEPGVKIDDQGNRHIAKPDEYIWNSRPPTSGPHGDLAAWGIHEETVHEWNQVHNLEDGGVIIHYNCPEGCPEIVEELTGIYYAVGGDKLILHPYTNMDSKIALTAWTRLLTMDEVDHDLILDFIQAYRGIDHH